MHRRANGVVAALAALAALAVIAAAAGCHRDQPAAATTSDAAPSRGDRHSAGADPRTPAHRYVGVVVSADSVDVTSRIDGVVASLNVDLGDVVKSGDVVAIFDADALKANLDKAVAALDGARATLSQARARFENARSRYRRRKRLRNVVSAEERETARLAVRDAEAQVRKAKAAVASAQAQVDKLKDALAQTKLVAPKPGRVGYAYVSPGTAVSRGQPIIRIVGGNDLRIRFAVPADQSGKLAIGTPVLVRLAKGGRPLAAHITKLSPDLDPVSQMFIAEAELSASSHPGKRFRAGAAVSVVPAPAQRVRR